MSVKLVQQLEQLLAGYRAVLPVVGSNNPLFLWHPLIRRVFGPFFVGAELTRAREG